MGLLSRKMKRFWDENVAAPRDELAERDFQLETYHSFEPRLLTGRIRRLVMPRPTLALFNPRWP